MKYTEEYLVYLHSFSANLAGPSGAIPYTERPKALAQALGHLTGERISQTDSGVWVHAPFAYWRFEETLQGLLDSAEKPKDEK